ncbi:acyl-CoA dehydrogenase, partial [Rhizobium johnstonii]
MQRAFRGPDIEINEHLFARAEDISADLSRRAADLEREGRPPLAEIVKLKNAGLLNELHHTQIGGGGLDWVDGLKLVRILASG